MFLYHLENIFFAITMILIIIAVALVHHLYSRIIDEDIIPLFADYGVSKKLLNTLSIVLHWTIKPPYSKLPKYFNIIRFTAIFNQIRTFV